MRDVADRSKAFWGYDQAFMETVGPTLAPTENDVSDGVFLLECDGVPAGFYAFKVKAESYFLDSLFLAPEWIGLGFGERL